jgi:hypothetical protein
MDYIWINTTFSVIVIGAVVFIGLVIAYGQNRQRRALEAVNGKVSRWAEEDLRLKRARAMKEVAVPETRQWVDQVATHVFGASPALTACNPWEKDDGTLALLSTCGDGRRLVLTPVEPERFRKAVAQRKARGRLSALARAETGVLGKNPKKVPVYDLNIVTAGIAFDLEAEKVWQTTFKRPLVTDRLYMFEVPARS